MAKKKAAPAPAVDPAEREQALIKAYIEVNTRRLSLQGRPLTEEEAEEAVNLRENFLGVCEELRDFWGLPSHDAVMARMRAK